MDQTNTIEPTSTTTSRLDPDQLVEVFRLLKHSTSVEVKAVVSDSHRATLSQMGFDPVEAQPRQVYFFDTPDLALNKAGVIVRARRSAGGRGDTVVKLRPIEPTEIDKDLRRDPAFKIEVDVMPGGFVCSGSAKGRCTASEVLEASQGKVKLSSIFSKEQVQFYKEHAPAGLLMKDLVPLGPTFILKLKHSPQGFPRDLVSELWFFPDGSRMLEVSVSGLPAEAFQLGAEFRGFMAHWGIPLDKSSTAKTAKALAYFSERLKTEATA